MKRMLSYRSLRIGALVSLLSLAATAAAQAASVSYNAPFGFSLSPGSQVVNLPQWDPAAFPGQVLVGVTLEIDATIGANVTAENDSATGGSMGVSLTGIASATAGSLSATASILQNAGPVAVSGTDGVGGSGPDFNDFGLISGNDSDTDSIFAGMGAYVGNGNFAANVFGSGGFAVSGVSDSTIQVSGFATNGQVTVTYEYAAVPEPASLALSAMGAVGLALVGWRRRRTG